jgi:hypothetical protein
MLCCLVPLFYAPHPFFAPPNKKQNKKQKQKTIKLFGLNMNVGMVVSVGGSIAMKA